VIGTVVLDEQIHAIGELHLRDGSIELVVRIEGPVRVPAMPFGTEYRVHGSDGSLVWRGALDIDVPAFDLGDTDAWELHLRSEVTGKMAVR